MKKVKTIVLSFLLLTLFSCSENESELSIRDMVFNQNNNGTGNTLPKTNVLSFNTTSYNFGTVQNGSTNQLLLEIRNSHTAPVNVTLTHTNSITQISFTETNFQIPANGSYNITVTFSPTATMFLNDTLQFSYSANQSNSSGPITQTIKLNGNSVATLPTSLTVAPSGTIDFGTLVVGQTATKNITLTNTGTVTATWTPVGNTLSFNPVGGSINAGSSQIVAMSITATGTGTFNNTQTFSYNGGTVQVPYTVNRIVATRIIDVSTTASTAFGNVAVNTTVTKTIKISNTGNSNIIVSQITTSQVPNGQYACSYSGTIAPNSSVNVSISFKPTSKGSSTCSIIVQSDKTSGNNSLNFTGFGI